MNTLHQIGVHPKVYRAWFNLNKRTSIRVNTAVGMSDRGDVGEVIGQGSAGGALASQVNIDKGLESYFKGSVDEVNYGGVRLQPLSFQDDIARAVRGVKEALVGNMKMRSLMEEKQLQVHPDKTGFIVLGCKKFKEEVEKELGATPIIFGNLVTGAKVMDKYLGDMIHTDGLAASVEATINDRAGKVQAAGFEVAAIIEDFRMQAVGGLMGAWDLWNLAIVPSLLSNCGIWTEIDAKSVQKLDEMQEAFIRRILQVPISTPKVSLRSETGLLSMKLRIWGEKIKMVLAIRKMDKTFLARQIYEEQVQLQWPGLAREVEVICSAIGIPDVNQSTVNKRDVDMAIQKVNREEIVKEMKEKYKKLDELVDTENGLVKDYMKTKNIMESRMLFRIRTKMLDLKENMKGRYKSNLECDACDSQESESQSHIMRCEGYKSLREGMDFSQDKDLVNYFSQVMKIRMAQK